MENFISDVSRLVGQSCQIDKDLFDKYNVKRGLRNADGSGVLVGLTSIGDVVGYRREGDTLIPTEGDLRYRGFPIRELVRGFQKENRHGFEETTFLLLTGKLPTSLQLAEMTTHLASKRDLDDSFVNMILTLRGRDLMNMLSRSVLILYTLDDTAEDYSLPSLVKQSLNLIAKLPIIVAYSYQGMRHYRKSLVIRHPQANLSAAENFLYLLKGNKYTPLEAEILDLMMILHAEHGGGNNSTFTMRLVSSAMTDTYSATAAAIGSLKGRLHGGANLQVLEMMTNIKKNVKNWNDKEEIKSYLMKILRKEAYDRSGKIYGIGHAVYTLSDPRAQLLKTKAIELAKAKGLEAELQLYLNIEELAPKALAEYKNGNVKPVCANVDFFSGFVYEAIEIPHELFTPMFAIARMSGWAAHRLEEMTFASRRIIRPAYKNILQNEYHYVPLQDR